jgi:hypothetical protein
MVILDRRKTLYSLKNFAKYSSDSKSSLKNWARKVFTGYLELLIKNLKFWLLFSRISLKNLKSTEIDQFWDFECYEVFDGFAPKYDLALLLRFVGFHLKM